MTNPNPEVFTLIWMALAIINGRCPREAERLHLEYYELGYFEKEGKA